MREKISFILLLLFFTIPSVAQSVFDIGGNIDKFTLSVGSFKMAYSRNLPEITQMTEFGKLYLIENKMKFDRDTIPTNNFKYPYYYSISADSLRSMTIKDWEILLKNKSLIIKEDSTECVLFNTHEGSLMFCTEYDHNKYSNAINNYLPNGFEYNNIYSIPCSYSYIRITDNKYIVVLRNHQLYNSDIDGYIIPFKDHLRLRIRHIEKDVDYDMPQYPLFDKDSLYYQDLLSTSFYTTMLTSNGQQQLCDHFFYPFPIVADTIQLLRDYIIANDLSKQECIIYDKLLARQPIKNIRSITSDLQMLIGKKIKWFENGKLSDKRIIRPYSIPDLASKYYFGMEKAGNNFIFHQSGSTQYGEDRPKKSFTLTNPENVDSLFFENRQIALYTSHFPDAQKPRDIDILYTKTKEQKYNICTYTIDYDAMTFTIIPMLTTDVDQVKMNHPRYFYHKGKVGYFPEMKTADYKEIKELNGNFLRVKTLNNKKGWYNLENKVLYYD